MLNDDAKASDTVGIHYYAEDLTHLLLPNNAGEPYINSFAGRLTRAIQETRDGKRKLIPETQVIATFNELAKNENLAVMANADSLRRYRTESYFAKTYPTLFTANRNGTNCEPGEAVFLLSQLIRLGGDLTPPKPPELSAPANAQPPFMMVGTKQDVIQGSQTPKQVAKEFNAVAKSLGI
jgi:hypothetical protein